MRGQVSNTENLKENGKGSKICMYKVSKKV